MPVVMMMMQCLPVLMLMSNMYVNDSIKQWHIPEECCYHILQLTIIHRKTTKLGKNGAALKAWGKIKGGSPIIAEWC